MDDKKILSLTHPWRLLIFYLLLVVATALFTGSFLTGRDLSGNLPLSAIYLDKDQNPLRITLAPDEQYRIWRKIEAFPPELKESVLLYEDRWFHLHPGINPVALLRGFMATYILKNRRIGGSTVSMQTARLYFNLSTSHPAGKIRQIGAALFLEFFYSKKEILETYLNLVPCGANIVGYPAAARIYFDKEITDLNLSEIFTLVALPQNPIERTPLNGVENEKLRNAKERIFAIWIVRHPEDKENGSRLLAPIRLQRILPFEAPHFVDHLIKNNRGNGPIVTTLNLQLQKIVEKIASLYLAPLSERGVKNTAILLLNSRTMAIEALFGSADYFDPSIDGQVDGTNAKRAPGSTLKPFIYTLAIEQGLIHPGTILKDSPTSFGEYTPDNFLSHYSGVMNAEEALNHSRNVPAVTLARELNNPDLYDLLAKAQINGLKGRDHYGLSLVLGSGEVTMIELLCLYAALSNYGVMQPARRLMTDSSIQKIPLFTEEAAYITVDMLTRNTPPQGKEIKMEVAYKTGTSTGFKDAWSVAIFGDYILGVWIGNFDGSPNPEFLGRKRAAPLLFSLIRALEDHLPRQRRKLIPEGIKKVNVSSISGGFPLAICTESLHQVWFIPGISPIDRCHVHQEIFLNAKGLRTTRYAEDRVAVEVMELWPSDVMELFEKAGFPRKPPPPFVAEIPLSTFTGTPPVILSPRISVDYIVSPEDEFDRIPFQAAAESGVEKLYWFLDKRFLGETSPNEVFQANAGPGRYLLQVMDERGRSAKQDLVVDDLYNQ